MVVSSGNAAFVCANVHVFHYLKYFGVFRCHRSTVPILVAIVAAEDGAESPDADRVEERRDVQRDAGRLRLLDERPSSRRNLYFQGMDNYVGSANGPHLQDGDRFLKIPEVYVRGATIKYLRIPDEVRRGPANVCHAQCAFRSSTW